MVAPMFDTTGSYKSAYGPKYHYQPNLFGMNPKQLTRLGFHTAKFGVFAGVAVLFFASGIPRVHQDVLSHIPVLGRLTEKPEVPASDNPF